jgi:cytochrome c-type biogenesis protein CcmH/NrfG
MSGWITLGGLAIAAAALLVLLRFPRALWMVAATALTLGAAGYAWQGTPGLAGHPVTHERATQEIDPGLIAMREAMFGRFNLEDAYFKIADAMMRTGDAPSAARAMTGALVKYPDDGALWTWSGVTLAAQDGGMVSPASRFAFERALALAPKHPGPYYFFGLTLAQGGQPAEARQYWAKAVELSPEGAAYRQPMVDQLARLDAFLASAPPAGAPAN